MSPIRRRRLLTVAGTCLSSIFAGCLTAPSNEPGTSDSPTATNRGIAAPTVWGQPPGYDCANASRPEPDPPATVAEEALYPVSYPDRPDSLSDTQEVITYIESHERAYRQNALIEKHGSELVGHSMYIEDSRTFDASDGSALVRLQYTYSETQKDGDMYVVGDSALIAVTYYLDESVLIRAEGGKSSDSDALDPNPWETGVPVECFE